MALEQSHRIAGVATDKEKRHKDDWYPTPPDATLALLEREKFHGPIWEPAAGDGAMSEIIKAAGYDVISTDLVDRGYTQGGTDFLMEWKPRAPNIITNPPFKLAEQFLVKALSLTTGKVAFLCRLNWLAGQGRGKFFKTAPLEKVYVFSYRLKFIRPEWEDTGNGGLTDYAWFVFSKGYVGSPKLDFIVEKPVEKIKNPR